MNQSEDATQAQNVATQLMQQYGDDAEVIATLRAAEIAAMGDAAALAHWDLVIAILRGDTTDRSAMN